MLKSSYSRGSVIADMVLVTNNNLTESNTEKFYSDWLAYQVTLGNGYLKDDSSGLQLQADSTFFNAFGEITIDGPTAEGNIKCFNYDVIRIKSVVN